MAVCTSLDANNYVQANATSPADCTGYLLVTPSEFAAFQPTQWTLQESADFIAITALIWGVAWIFRQARNQLLNRQN